ncbi:hypothetical protein KIP72_18940, partial [Pseudomonas aeruginosa]|uniref:hypothetical protein n=1 Tax=Pseudomonas aeruginosa TaxID=287 RepID=UPI001BFF38F8
LDNSDGQLISQGRLDAILGGALVNTGAARLASGGDLLRIGGALDNQGGRLDSRAGNLDLQSGSLDNGAGGVLNSATAGQGGKVGAGRIDFSLAGALANRFGQLESESELHLRAAAIDNSGGSLRALGRSG